MSTTDNLRVQAQKDPAQLEREIDQQRNHIAELVGALTHKLSPGEMFESVLRRGKDGGGEFVGNLGHTIKSHPVPTLLATTGLLWLYASGRHDTTDATTSEAEEGVGRRVHLGERVQHVREGASERIEGVRRTAHGAADRARHGAQRTREGFEHLLQDNPMALGAMGVAAGAVLGAMLPVTRKEHEVLGEARDRLARKARETARSDLGSSARAGHGATTPTSVDSERRPGH